MEIEIQGIPQSIRPSYQARIKASKGDLQRYKKLSKDLHSQLARAELLARPGMDANTDEPYGATSDRTRLLQGTALLEDGSRRLMESQRIALETEEQGADILRSLRGQREQIQNARDTVSVLPLSPPADRGVRLSFSLDFLADPPPPQLNRADTNIDRASGTLKKMIRRYVHPLQPGRRLHAQQ